MKYIAWAFVVLLLTYSCDNKRNIRQEGKYYRPNDALGFQIDTLQQSYVLRVRDPWQGANGIEYKYIIGDFGYQPKSDDSIGLPVKRVVCMSTSHSAFIESMDQGHSIIGISGKYNYSPFIQANLKSGSISDIGNDYQLNVEKLLALRPDVIFVYGVDGEFQSTAMKLRNLGFKLVFIGDYLEETPLGKAEWRIAFSLFYDQLQAAIAEHKRLEDRYNGLKQLVTNVTYKPKVMLNTPFNEVWYLPGLKNYVSHYVSDAGAAFAYQTKYQRESYPIPYESAIIDARKADYWINVGAHTTLTQLKAQLPRFQNVPAVNKCKVYNNNKRRTIAGGSDFWESGAVSPDLVLEDLIRIFHPDKLSPDTLHFYQPLL